MNAKTPLRHVRASRRSLNKSQREAVERALRTLSYEVLPFKGTEEQVLANVPRDVPLTVTATEVKGLTPTVDLAARLAEQGYRAAPHMAARLVRDRVHLSDLVAQLDAAGVDGIFVVGGDARQPAGDFPDALALLEALETMGHPFTRVGITGYPEGHGHIADEVIVRALEEKARHATLAITQLCFSPQVTMQWLRAVRERGLDLPIRIGIPGAVSRQKLVRISAGLGLGQSARFLKKQQNMFWRFFLPGGYSPNRLIEGLSDHLAEPEINVKSFHVFTFNEVEKTEKWRQEWLGRLT